MTNKGKETDQVREYLVQSGELRVRDLVVTSGQRVRVGNMYAGFNRKALHAAPSTERS